MNPGSLTRQASIIARLYYRGTISPFMGSSPSLKRIDWSIEYRVINMSEEEKKPKEATEEEAEEEEESDKPEEEKAE